MCKRGLDARTGGKVSTFERDSALERPAADQLTAARLFPGISANSLAIPHQPVIAANVRPAPTGVGRAMLVEFDYRDNLVPSFPGLIAPLGELWISWLMKEAALKATYNAMLRGKA